MSAQHTLWTTTAKVTPDESGYGMVAVSKGAFFATVGQLNVYPSIEGKWDTVLGYLSKWKTPMGKVLGATVGGTHLSENAYMVTPEFYEQNRAAIAKATGSAS